MRHLLETEQSHKIFDVVRALLLQELSYLFIPLAFFKLHEIGFCGDSIRLETGLGEDNNMGDIFSRMSDSLHFAFVFPNKAIYGIYGVEGHIFEALCDALIGCVHWDK